MNEQNNQQDDRKEAKQTAASETTGDHSTDKLTDLPVTTEQAEQVAGGGHVKVFDGTNGAEIRNK